MHVRITEENCLEALYSFADAFYSDQISKSINECPYDMDQMIPDLVYKQVMTWFILERRHPNGLTVLDEFINMAVEDPRLKSKMRQMSNLTYDSFLIERSSPGRLFTGKAESTGQKYRIETVGPNPDAYRHGGRFTGRIYPWHEDGTHRIAGIPMMDDPDLFELAKLFERQILRYEQQEIRRVQNRLESTSTSKWPTTRSLLKKYPAMWVDGICDMLNLDRAGKIKNEKINMLSNALSSGTFLSNLISKMSEDEKSALKLVMENRYRMKHSRICKRFGPDDTDILWEKNSISVVGRLRQLGVLAVGRQTIRGRTYKVVVIPEDVAANLGPILRFGIFDK